MFPFDPPENIRKPKGTLGRKGLSLFKSVCFGWSTNKPDLLLNASEISIIIEKEFTIVFEVTMYTKLNGM